MFKAQSIALYKNRPVLVLDIRDKIEIRIEDGSTLRVRDKDLAPLHPGPVTKLPEPAAGGDFDTARAMLATEGAEATPTGWLELAELVFGASGPAEALACWREAAEGRRYRIVDGAPAAMSDAEVEREAAKRERKEGEAAALAAFVARAKLARTGKAGEGAEAALLPEDERFLAEIEAFALGKSAKCRLASEIGFAEEAEAAAAFLLASGRWDDTVDPYPSRSGCAVSAPRIELGPEVEDGLPRADLRGTVAWAIDNAWSKDPDDAIAWDGSSVWVHVADPAAAILPDSPADREALARGSTLYLPELTAPMLPDEALERFGLGLGEGPAPGELPTSRALSFRIEVAQDGSIAAVEAMASLVKVRRASYGQADELVDAGRAPDLVALAEIAGRRAARRAANGAVEIDIPEVRVHVGEGPEGPRTIFIDPVPEDRSSGLVREMMLLAGEAAARWAFERGLAFPYYSQEAPGEPGAAAAAASLAAQFARRRTMRAGISGPSPQAHRGLGLPFYAQATSPLRRYQDLLGHMQIRAALAGRPPLDADEVGRRCAMAQAASAATRQAERSGELHWTLAYLRRRPGWEGEAVLVGAAGPGAWQAYIPALGLETRLKLGPDRALDERVRVRLARIDLAKLESSFEAPQ
jgi:exoribonuclease-2